MQVCSKGCLHPQPSFLQHLKELEQLHKEDQNYFSPIPFLGLTLLPAYPCCCVSRRQRAIVEAELTACEIGNWAGITGNIRSLGLNQLKLIARRSSWKQFRPKQCLFFSGWPHNEILFTCCGSSLQHLNFPIWNIENIFLPLSRWVYYFEYWELASCLLYWYLFFPFELTPWVYQWVLGMYYSWGGGKCKT